ncbi:hypothetical protein LCGC14_1482440 [marine sediment metagenome]|uniref:Uncharacterized protein n=1 Tax=marine sediment metagenome TaxID=412755 RepID=A0A0F9J9T7_9ZZZZ
MGKETAIKVSKEFKQFLVDNKKKGEDFEETIKRLVNHRKLNSEPVNQPKLKQLTSTPKDTERKRLDEEHKNLPELPGEVLSRDELPNEVGGVKIK